MSRENMRGESGAVRRDEGVARADSLPADVRGPVLAVGGGSQGGGGVVQGDGAEEHELYGGVGGVLAHGDAGRDDARDIEEEEGGGREEGREVAEGEVAGSVRWGVDEEVG